MSVNKRDSTTGELVTLASGTRMWVGTKSAHDIAVANGTMPNNVMVCITDDAAGEEAWTYSTEETNTGKTWIDGKPIYRKVLHNVLIPASLDATGWAVNGSNSIPSNMESLITLTIADSTYLPARGKALYISDASEQYKVFQYHTSIVVKTNIESALNSTCDLILEYTKTTD